MEGLQTRAGTGVETLDGLAIQARLLTQSLALNYVQLGRVLCEAKALVKHGEWGKWIAENAPVGERAAQNMIQVYKRFGGNPSFTQIESSKLVKLLALPDGSEDDFASENNINDMSARDVEMAIKAKKGIVSEGDCAPPMFSDEAFEKLREKELEANTLRSEIDRTTETAKEAVLNLREANEENARLRSQCRMNDEMLEEQQASLKQAQAELLKLKSGIARNEVETLPDEGFMPSAFATAVRQFMGACQAMPHMGRAFSIMDDDAVQSVTTNLTIVENWAIGVRGALNVIQGEVVEL